ncbi:MAG: SWIM zinc finger family protein [Thermomicrobiales bacterium]
MGRPHAPSASPPIDSTTAPLPEITAEHVKSQTDPPSFSRGKNYQRRGMIYDASLRGTQLRAMCGGSSGGPYHVQATLVTPKSKRASPIADWYCDCPRGGFCKHVVALLLTWIETPDDVEQRPPLAHVLADKSREELVVLLAQLVDRLPEADELLDRIVPVSIAIPPHTPGAGTEKSVDLAAVRRKADAALKPFRMDAWNDYAYDLVNPIEIATDIEEVRAIGDRYADAGRWADARAVYEMVAERIMDHHNESFDPEGYVLNRFAACGIGLLRCLEAQADLSDTERLPASARRDLLDAILRFWRFDRGGPIYDDSMLFGGSVGFSTADPTSPPIDVRAFREIGPYPDEDDAEFAVGFEDEPPWVKFEPGPIFATSATVQERTRIEQQVRELIRPDGKRVNHELQRAAVRLLADLSGQTDDAARLAAYKDANLWADAIVLLVRQGNLHDATVLAARTLTDAHAALSFASFLSNQGGDLPRQAVAFVEDRLWETEGNDANQDGAYRAWLSKMYAQHGSPERSFALERRRFDSEPGYPTYLAVKQAATLPGQEAGLWERTRPELIQALEERQELSTLLEVHLEAGEVRKALDTLPRMETAPKQRVDGLFRGSYEIPAWHNLDHYRRRLAEAAAKDFPEEAIPLYLDQVNKLIERRNRDSYRQAATYLSQVKSLYQKTDRVADWRTLFAELRDRHRRLPALQQEMDARQLI